MTTITVIKYDKSVNIDTPDTPRIELETNGIIFRYWVYKVERWVVYRISLRVMVKNLAPCISMLTDACSFPNIQLFERA